MSKVKTKLDKALEKLQNEYVGRCCMVNTLSNRGRSGYIKDALPTSLGVYLNVVFDDFDEAMLYESWFNVNELDIFEV